MPANHRCPFGHQRHDEPAAQGRRDQRPAGVEVAERRELPADAVQQGQVGEQGDELDEDVGRAAADQAQGGSHKGEEQQALRRRTGVHTPDVTDASPRLSG